MLKFYDLPAFVTNRDLPKTWFDNLTTSTSECDLIWKLGFKTESSGWVLIQWNLDREYTMGRDVTRKPPKEDNQSDNNNSTGRGMWETAGRTGGGSSLEEPTVPCNWLILKISFAVLHFKNNSEGRDFSNIPVPQVHSLPNQRHSFTRRASGTSDRPRRNRLRRGRSRGDRPRWDLLFPEPRNQVLGVYHPFLTKYLTPP